MLDVRRLRLLSELARRGTIAEVGRAVGYSASAVSQSLAQLERETGMALLERDGRHVRLTPAAHRLVARTDRVLAELDAAEAELAAEQGSVRGELVIGAFPSAGARLVAPAVRELAAPASGVDVRGARARARGRDPAAALRRAGPARLRELRPRPGRARRRPRAARAALRAAAARAARARGGDRRPRRPRRRGLDQRDRRDAVRGRGRAGVPARRASPRGSRTGPTTRR